jgi:RNA polymerase sigma factor (sigma-70 family)
LIRRAQSGEKRARNDLAARLIPYARSLARRLCKSRRACLYDEVFSAACLGIAEAIDRFDLERKTRWTTYAIYYARWRALGVVQADVATHTGYSVSSVRRGRVPGLGHYDVRCAQLDRVAGNRDAEHDIVMGRTTERTAPVLDLLRDVADPEGQYGSLERSVQLFAAIDALPTPQRRVIRARWLGEFPRTLEQTAGLLKIPKRLVAEYEREAMATLKQVLTEDDE